MGFEKVRFCSYGTMGLHKRTRCDTMGYSGTAPAIVHQCFLLREDGYIHEVAEGFFRKGGWRKMKSGHVQIRQTKFGHVQIRQKRNLAMSRLDHRS
jgi:hypothetical protein